MTLTDEQREALNTQIADRRKILSDEIASGNKNKYRIDNMKYQVVKLAAFRDGLWEEFTERYESAEQNIIETFARENGIDLMGVRQ